MALALERYWENMIPAQMPEIEVKPHGIAGIDPGDPGI